VQKRGETGGKYLTNAEINTKLITGNAREGVLGARPLTRKDFNEKERKLNSAGGEEEICSCPRSVTFSKKGCGGRLGLNVTKEKFSQEARRAVESHLLNKMSEEWRKT